MALVGPTETVTAKEMVPSNDSGDVNRSGDSSGDRSGHGNASVTGTGNGDTNGRQNKYATNLHAVSELGEDDGPRALAARLMPREVLSQNFLQLDLIAEKIKHNKQTSANDTAIGGRRRGGAHKAKKGSAWARRERWVG